MICRKCGTPSLKDTDKFCSECGTRFEQNNAPPTEEKKVVTDTMQENVVQKKNETEEKKKKIKNIFKSFDKSKPKIKLKNKINKKQVLILSFFIIVLAGVLVPIIKNAMEEQAKADEKLATQYFIDAEIYLRQIYGTVSSGEDFVEELTDAFSESSYSNEGYGVRDYLQNSIDTYHFDDFSERSSVANKVFAEHIETLEVKYDGYDINNALSTVNTNFKMYTDTVIQPPNDIAQFKDSYYNFGDELMKSVKETQGKLDSLKEIYGITEDMIEKRKNELEIY